MIQKHHIVLKDKKISADINDNLLYQQDNIFLMDNHRLALWSWLKVIDLKKKYNLFHIDAHPDMSLAGVDFYSKTKHAIEKLDLDQYRTILQDDINIPLFRWDNYISFFTKYYSNNFDENESISCTHKLGSQSGFKKDMNPIYLIREMQDIFFERKFINENKWIVNLDLDFFYTSAPQKEIMFSEAYIQSMMDCITYGIEHKSIACLTIALSPECCGGWDRAEQIFKKINNTLKLDFTF